MRFSVCYKNAHCIYRVIPPYPKNLMLIKNNAMQQINKNATQLICVNILKELMLPLHFQKIGLIR